MINTAQNKYNISLMQLLQAKANLLRITWNSTWRISLIGMAASLAYRFGIIDQHTWWLLLAICGCFILYMWISSWRNIGNTPWWMMLVQSYHIAVPEDCDWQAAEAMTKQLKGICLPYEPFGMAFSNKRSAVAFKLAHGGQ